jgi:hypothetical protein
VEIFMGTEFLGYHWEEHSGWCIQLRSASDRCASPVAPARISGVEVLLGADGLGSRSVGKQVGVKTVELSCLKAEAAIGLVVNFAPLRGSPAGERSVTPFNMAKQGFVELFQNLHSTTGVELENIVYTKAKLSHYFVMTPTRRCLIKTGVVRDPSYKPVLARDNIDAEALDTLVRKVAGFHFKDNKPTLTEVAADAGLRLLYADKGPQLFDFSGLRRVSEGLVFCDPPGSVAHADKDALLVALVGDALLEPFWPEGLGIVRGFFSAFDASSAIVKWASGEGREATRDHFAKSYAQLKTLAAKTRHLTLRPDSKAYALAPSSRYRSIVADT